MRVGGEGKIEWGAHDEGKRQAGEFRENSSQNNRKKKVGRWGGGGTRGRT